MPRLLSRAQALVAVSEAEGERQMLLKAAHAASFERYPMVNDAKGLLRSLISV